MWVAWDDRRSAGLGIGVLRELRREFGVLFRLVENRKVS